MRAEVAVEEADGFAVGDAKAVVGGGRKGRGCGACGAAAAVVKRLVVFVVGGVHHSAEVAAAAGAGVDRAGMQELVECGAVKGEALRLGDHGRLPGDAEPAQVFEHGVDELGAGALRVEVLVAQEERAVGVAGSGEGGPEGCGVAEVEQAGGGGSEAADVGHESMITGGASMRFGGGANRGDSSPMAQNDRFEKGSPVRNKYGDSDLRTKRRMTVAGTGYWVSALAMA